eukprot:558483-Rhodomonas_salina.1
MQKRRRESDQACASARAPQLCRLSKRPDRLYSAATPGTRTSNDHPGRSGQHHGHGHITAVTSRHITALSHVTPRHRSRHSSVQSHQSRVSASKSRCSIAPARPDCGHVTAFHRSRHSPSRHSIPRRGSVAQREKQEGRDRGGQGGP